MAPRSHTTGTGISQLDAEILRLRAYALSMTEGILKELNDANEEVRENINGVANDINYGRSLLRADLETTKNDSRNQYTSIQSTLSSMESLINRHEFTHPQPQFAPGMWEPNKDRLKVPCQQHGDNKKQEHGDNKSKEHGTPNSKPTSKYSPFTSRPLSLEPSSLTKHGISLNVVKRKTNSTKGSSMPNKKPVNRDKHTQVSAARELWPDSQMDDILTPPTNDFPDLKVSETNELRPDSQMHDILTPPANDFPVSKVSDAHDLRPDSQMHNILTPPSSEFELKVPRKNTPRKKTPGDGYDDPFPVPDSTSSDDAKQKPRKVISALLPEQPRSRRPTQLPSKIKKDFVDPSTRLRNKRRRYDPFRPIELDYWLIFRDWYNNRNADEKTILGIYYNFKKPDVADPYWFETIYKPQGWLGISHVNAYMLLLRDRMKTHPTSFQSNVCIFSHELSVFLTEAKTRKPRVPDLRVTSVLNELCKLRKDTIVYTPWVHGSHWVALVINIPLWKITVYDCMYFAGINSEMDKKLQDMATVLPLVLKLNTNFNDDTRTAQPFLLEKLDHNACPQMDYPGDCGVFTVKYIEHMILKDVDLSDVTQENMDVFREKMCIDIFHHIVDV